ncbi:glucose/galactose MFS transporter [Vibrio sinensis]|uniref:glucose/galactose MFS transporter n=1 Tax=Vibrio sinensis TaxID=2302434 RepID=UPI0014029D26|nr:glucose/galactose MFS transporter [Vibrio sinensis]
MTKHKTIVALTLLCCAFFTWGFLTSINSILVPYAQVTFDLSITQSMWIQSVFYTSPLLVCLPTVTLIKSFGYRTALIISLSLISFGSMFAAFAFMVQMFIWLLLAIFVIACGVAMLQVIANPYIVSLGDASTAPQRLTFASTVNSLGTTVAPYMAAHLLFSEYENVDVLLYVCVSAAIALLALSIYVVKISEPSVKYAKDDITDKRGLFAHKHLVFGIIALFCYTGVETSIGSLLVSYLNTYADFTPASAAKMVTFYWGGAMLGRLLGSIIFSRINSRYVLVFNSIAAISIVSVVLLFPSRSAAYLLVSVGLLNSIMYPVIFSLAVRDLDSYTEKASGFLVMAGLGGATIPLLQTSLSSSVGLNNSFLIPIGCYLFILCYAMWLFKTKQSDLTLHQV